MVSVFVSGSSSLGHCTRNLTLTVALSIQLYEWVTANLMLGVTLHGLASHPSTLLHNETETGISFGFTSVPLTIYMYIFPFYFFSTIYIGFCSR